MGDLNERIRHPESRAKVMTAAEAAGLFRDGMLVATSGSMMGFPKATFGALAEQVRTQGVLRIDLMCAGPLSSEFEDVLFEAGAIRRRIGAIGGEKLRGGINRGEVGALLFPRPDECRRLAGVPADMPLPELLHLPQMRAFFQTLADRLWREATGSANRGV